MSKFIQALQPRAAAIIVALAIITGGASTASNTYALGGESETKERTTERPVAPSVDDSQNRLRTQQREALEAKKQEAKAAKDAAEARLKARHEARQEKLSASQLEICKSRESNINNRIARIADRSTKHLELFDMIAIRAQSFYASNGNTLANYDELVADVAEKKAAAESAVTTISSTTVSFDCEGENPKVTIEEYKASLRASIEVLKDYRSSVKNLIIGIKSVNSDKVEDNSNTSDGTNQ